MTEGQKYTLEVSKRRCNVHECEKRFNYSNSMRNKEDMML